MAKKGKYVYEWPRPMVTVDAVVFLISGRSKKVLLIERGNEPYKGLWALPGGFIEIDEELEDATARELKEETGLDGIKLQQLRTYGTVGRDPRGRQISVVFMGILKDEKKQIKAGDDAAKIGWFDLKKLPTLAFDHKEIIRFTSKKLKEKLR
jgi:8-oxo-dGTP diphosphatase